MDLLRGHILSNLKQLRTMERNAAAAEKQENDTLWKDIQYSIPTPKQKDLQVMLDTDVVKLLHRTTTPPSIRPYDTPNGSDRQATYTAEELHKILGFRKLKNFKHMTEFSDGATFLDNGEFPVHLGQFATINKAPRGKAIEKEAHSYLERVHLDIAFGDCLSLKDFLYALVFVDRATRYNWVFGLKNLSSATLI